ncbi:WD domain repeat-containing protein 55 [Borealophlyctis nickersoniae]|nr:WD domain repeat-containing protein 55 [Borealophlyctis nickersoniae]
MKYKENVDFISDMEFVEHKKTLVVASGDGCLSIFDIRKSKPVAVSANQDDELLSVAVVRNTTKAVVGTQSGTLLFFSWADWGDCTDRFPGHPSSIDSIAKLDETTILTASSDGIIRSIGIMPNRLVGVCGEHGEMPVERIRLSRDGEWVGSCGHDQMVRFWSVDGIERVDEDEEGDDSEEGDEEEGDEEEDEEVYSDAEEPQEGNGENGEGENDSDADSEDASSIPKPAAPTAPAAAKRAKANSSDDSDDSDAEKKKKKKKRKKAKRGIAGAKKGKSFFAGLD